MGDRPLPDLAFRGMAFWFKVRDLLRPRMNILGEVGIGPGFHVLDFGCGPGSYIAPLAKLVGNSGKVYALDLHPLAINTVRNLVRTKRLANVETIRSDCDTGLPDSSIDAVLLYDILHDLTDPGAVLAELGRVLKTGGVLSVTDHHLTSDDILARVTGGGLFRLARRGEKTHSFSEDE